jgi:hypothetical protein
MTAFYGARAPLMSLALLVKKNPDLRDKRNAYWQTFKEHLKLFRPKYWTLIDQA